jgi:hypothetical protein
MLDELSPIGLVAFCAFVYDAGLYSIASCPTENTIYFHRNLYKIHREGAIRGGITGRQQPHTVPKHQNTYITVFADEAKKHNRHSEGG